MSSRTFAFETSMNILRKLFLLLATLFPPLHQRFFVMLLLFVTITMPKVNWIQKPLNVSLEGTHRPKRDTNAFTESLKNSM